MLDEEGLRATAARETFEETGIDLADVHVSDEVEELFWVPLTHLLESARQGHHTVEGRSFPAIVLGRDRPLLWGVTYRFAEQLLAQVQP